MKLLFLIIYFLIKWKRNAKTKTNIKNEFSYHENKKTKNSFDTSFEKEKVNKSFDMSILSSNSILTLIETSDSFNKLYKKFKDSKKLRKIDFSINSWLNEFSKNDKYFIKYCKSKLTDLQILNYILSNIIFKKQYFK